MTTKIKIAAIRFIQILLWWVPIRNNRIMFYANNRKGYVCNPAALMKALQSQRPDQYELIWVTRFPETCRKRPGITVVKQRSLTYFKLFLRTKFFITNDMVDEALVKKNGQIFLTTWHGGGAYKKVGSSALKEDDGFAKNFHKWYSRLDYFVSSCQVCTDLYAGAFGLDRRIFLETGTPRNDIFFHEHPEIARRVRDFYKLEPDIRILLFAPSFQMSAPEKEIYDTGVLADIAAKLRDMTGESWCILYRCHYFRENDVIASSDLVKNGNAYYEIQDLLYASDVLVTDFSSCIWDFALTGRPIVVLEPRLKEYERQDRGFFVSYEKWPYIKCQSLSELPDIIQQYGSRDFSEEYAAHFEEMGSFEQGKACQDIINLIEQQKE